MAAALRRAAARPPCRQRDPGVASRKRSARTGRLLAALHAAGARRGRRGARLRRTTRDDGAQCGHGQSARLRRRCGVGRQLPWAAHRARARRDRNRVDDARGTRGAAPRARGEPRSVVGTAGLSRSRPWPRIGLHDGADRRRRARRRLPRARDSGERAVGADRRQSGGRRADGDDRRMESGTHPRQCRAHRGDRAARRRAGTRIPEAVAAGEGCCANARHCASVSCGAHWRSAHDDRHREGRERHSGREIHAVTGPPGPPGPAPRTVRAPRGPTKSCKGWVQEAALRMLMNNLDPEVAERPQDLVVYGGTGKAARNWASFDAICRTLRTLENDETLLVQSGKPVGVFTTHPDAPRVLIANANLVPRYATWEVFRDLERRGLIMYGQMTAGSWIYIGTQGILQGTYETFGAVGARHFGGSLKGRIVLTGGLGGMGGAQPLAATMNEGICLAVEVDPARVQRRLETRYLDRSTASLDEALAWCADAKRRASALSVGPVGNCADVLPELVTRGFAPDVVTDQTSAHDPLNGYVPSGVTLAAAADLRRKAPDDYIKRTRASIAMHVRAIL